MVVSAWTFGAAPTATTLCDCELAFRVRQSVELVPRRMSFALIGEVDPAPVRHLRTSTHAVQDDELLTKEGVFGYQVCFDVNEVGDGATRE